MMPLYRHLKRLAGHENREVFCNTDRPEGYPRRAADTTRLKQATGGFVPATSLDEGLREMIELYYSEGKDD